MSNTISSTEAQRRQEILAELAKGGLTRRQLCERHGVSLQQLSYWKKLYSPSERRPRRKAQPAFVSARVTGTEVATQYLRLTTSNLAGYAIEGDALSIASLLAALRKTDH